MDNNKKKIGIIVGIIIAIIVVTIGIFTYLYFATDLFKTSQQLFYTYLKQNEQALDIMDISKKIENSNELLKDKAYTTNGKLTANLSGDESENIQINFNGKTDRLENKDYKKFTLINNNEELFDLEYLRTDDLYALTSKQVVNLYLAIQNNNLKAFAQKLGVEDTTQIPDKIEMANLNQNTKISEEMKNILSKYSNILIQQIPSEKYTKQKNVSMTIDEKNYNKLSVYTLKLTQKELVNALEPCLQTLKDDEETLNFFLELYKTDKTLDDLNALKNQMQELINEINDMEVTDNVAVKIDVYVSKDELIQTKVQVGNETDNNNLIIDILQNKININYIYNNQETIEETNVTSNILNIIAEKDEDNTLKVTLKKDNNIANLWFKEQIKDDNAIEKNMGLEYKVDGNTELKLSYNEQKEITQNIQIDNLDTNYNCVILNNYSQEELQIIMSQIGERLEQVFAEIDQKITGGALNTNVGIFSSANKTLDESTNESEEQEKEMFNSQFTTHNVHNISSTNVKSLLNTIISQNNSGNSKKVGVSYKELENKTSEEDIKLIMSETDNNNYYNVEFEYSDQGYINLVTITENN